MEEKSYFLYVIRCADNSLYTGITTDVKRRFGEHSGKGGLGAKYTRSRKPVSVVSVWRCSSRAVASKLEYAFKKLSKEKKEKLLLLPQSFPEHFAANIDIDFCDYEAEYSGYALNEEDTSK